MENHNIDSIFKKAINGSEDFYDARASKAKEKIWSQVQYDKQNKSKPFLFRLLVAACILLFLSTTIITISNFRTRKKVNTLVELNSVLKNELATNRKKEPIKKEPIATASIHSADTVYLEKQVIVEKPIILTKQIRDTVYIQQIVYVENEQTTESLSALKNEISSDTVSQTIVEPYETKILISNTEPSKKEKRKKFQLKLGGNKNQQSSGALAFSSKL